MTKITDKEISQAIITMFAAPILLLIFTTNKLKEPCYNCKQNSFLIKNLCKECRKEKSN